MVTGRLCRGYEEDVKSQVMMEDMEGKTQVM